MKKPALKTALTYILFIVFGLASIYGIASAFIAPDLPPPPADPTAVPTNTISGSRISGIIGVVNGGTGLTASGALNNILTSNGTVWVSQAPSGGLPTGASGQTLRHDGTNWVANSVIYNNGTSVGIGTPTPGQKLDVAGNININTNGTNALFSTYKGANSNGYNIFIGGGGQSSVGAVGDLYKGSNNVANGINAFYSNTNGYQSSAVGSNALYSNTTGFWNSAMGANALYSNTTGFWNSAVGLDALYYNTTGSFNSAMGAKALYFNTTGERNSAMGVTALYSNTTGYRNTAVGQGAGYRITTGNSNTFLGWYTGDDYGQKVDAVNSMALGNGAFTNADNKVVIGNTAVTVIGGQVGWSTFSDSRGKYDVQDYNHGLDLILKLRPVEFKVKDDTTKKQHSGFIAQEVEATGIPFNGINRPETEDGYYSLNYAEFVVPLVNSIKELKAENETLKKRIEILEIK